LAVSVCVLVPLSGGEYVTRPGVAVKYAFRFARVPVKVREVAVPPTVTPLAFAALRLPAATPIVTVMVFVRGESESANGADGKTRAPGTSSRNVKFAGIDTAGAAAGSVTLVILRV
jgi:hypothetical protein